MKRALALFARPDGARPPCSQQGAPAGTELPYVYTTWKHYTVKDGLPNDHIFAVKADGPRVWVGTEDGLALIDKPSGKVVKTWQEKDGLPFRAVTAIEVDKKTGDVWLGLFGGGLARFSGGAFEHWHQLNSGLVNDVVYGLTLENDNVWCATTAGASRFNTKTGEWTIFTEKNAPMEEIWNYGVHYADGKVRLAVWGSGVLEYDIKTGKLEGVPRPRRRDGDRPLPRRRHQPRHHDRRELRRGCHVGLFLLRRLALRRTPLARFRRAGRRAFPPTSTTTSRPAAPSRRGTAPTRERAPSWTSPPTPGSSTPVARRS